MSRPRIITLLLALLGVGVLLAAGCGRRDDSGPRVSAVVTANSPAVRAAVATQESLLAAPLPAAPHAREVRRYYHYSNLLHDPERRAAARDAFFLEWAAAPECAFLVEVGVIHGSRLGRRAESAALLEAAAGTDTSAAIFHFVQGRRDWGRRSGAGASFRRAADLAEDRDPLLAAWSHNRAARLDAAAGQIDAAYARLTRSLCPAWSAGGPVLSSALWRTISRIARSAGRLDDALAAAIMAEACAVAAGDGDQWTRSRLAIGRTHLQRGRYAAAADTFAACYTMAVDSGYVSLRTSATGLMAMVAQATGDLDREKAELRRLLKITRASADTNGMVRAAVALASGLRRAGDLSGARALIDWSDTVNTAWSAGDLTRTVRAQRAILLDQTGRYAAAESLWTLAVQDVESVPDRAQTIQLEINLIRQGLETNRPDLAYRALARARELDPEGLPRSQTFDTALHLMLAAAQLHARQGEYLLADAQMRRAEERSATANLQTAWFVSDTRGKVAREAGDGVTARRAIRRCVALADTLGEPDLMRRSRVRLGVALLADGRYAEAESLVSADRDAPEYWTRLNARLVTAMALAGGGDHGAALVAFAAADTVLGTDAPADLAVRLGLERGRSLAAVGRHHEAHDMFQAMRRTLDDPAAAATTELGQSFNRHIRREVAEALLGLLHDYPRNAGPPGAPAASREVAAWARRSTPTRTSGPRVEFFVGAARAFVWVTRGGGEAYHWEELPSPGELAELTEAVTTDLAYPGREVDVGATSRLGEALLGSLADRWPAETTLEIAPDGCLAAVPWAALPWPATGQPALQHGPLVITVGALAETRTAPVGNGLLAVGVDSGAVDGAPRLGQAEAEARAVAGAWQGGPVDLRVGAAGSLAGLLAGGLKGYRAIHISSHARVYEGADGHSAIHVAGDGALPLTIGQIVASHTDAELIYLSSCEGARRHRSAGRGVLSFADAFLAAGAGGVVATSVLVDDDAGRALAEAYYHHWLGGKERAAALRAALLELKELDPRWGHPFYWAFTNLYTRPTA